MTTGSRIYTSSGHSTARGRCRSSSPLGSESPTQWNEQRYLPLAEYGLKPGDEIALFARVADNDPAGAKGSESAVVRVRIIPRDVYERLVRARDGIEALAARYREAERRIEALADRNRSPARRAGKAAGGQHARHCERGQAARSWLGRCRTRPRQSASRPGIRSRTTSIRNLSRELESLAASLAGLTRDSRAARRPIRPEERGRRPAARRAGQRLSGGRKQLKDKAPGADRAPGTRLSAVRGSGPIRPALPAPARSRRTDDVAQGSRWHR